MAVDDENVPLHYRRVGYVRGALDGVEQTSHAADAVDWAAGEPALLEVLGDVTDKAVRAALTMVALRAVATFDKAVLRVAQDQAMPVGD